MHIINNITFYLLIIFSILCIKIVNAQNRDVYKNFSKIIIKIEDKKFDTIIAYNTFYKSNPKFAKFKLPFNDDVCIGKMILKKLSTFKFICSSGYTASGTYYPSKNAIDAFGKGTDSNGNKLSFRLVGEDISLKTNFQKILEFFYDKELFKKANKQKKKELLLSYSNLKICSRATTFKYKHGNIFSYGFSNPKEYFWSTDIDRQDFVKEAKARGLSCKVNQNNEFAINSNKKVSKTIVSSAELEKEKQKRKKLEQKLALFEKEKQKRIELEKKLAALQSEKKKQINKVKQNEIGSGFYVSKYRHIVTNQHVVNQCKKITVGDSMSAQIPADLIASDKRNDLAILQTISMEMASADTKSFLQNLSIEIVPIISGGLMRSEDVKGGEEILVAGYPLGNMVSDTIKVTKGIVSATKGMDNDVSQFEIDAVIRKGNSGGPVYDKRGNIVGVAVSRLNINRADTINFGIKGSTVKQFLSAHDVPTKWSSRKDDIDTKDIYKIASKQTVMVVCHR